MSTTADTSAEMAKLSEKQHRILEFLRNAADEQTYFKSRLIADELDMSPKEVGTNMTALERGEFEITVEKWGYSSSTTWMVTS
jgi:DNA-binding MarR family transcriptional regulator